MKKDSANAGLRTAEDIKKYDKIRDRSRIVIRVSPEENALLEERKAQDEWGNTSAMIKYMLFSGDAHAMMMSLASHRDPHAVCVILKNLVLDLTDKYLYALYRYDKDMKTLYEEEGVDLKKWTKATNRWNKELVNSTNEVLASIREMMDMFGLEAYRKTVRTTSPGTGELTKEEQDRIADEMFRESVALGEENYF